MYNSIENTNIHFENDTDDNNDEPYRGHINEDLMDTLMRTLENISNKKIIRNIDVCNIRDLIHELKYHSLVSTSKLEEHGDKMKSMQKDMDELLITLNMTNDAELPEKYNRLTDQYKELKMQMVDMSVQLAIEASKNADRSYEIHKMSSVNEYLTARVHLLSRKVKQMCDCTVCMKCKDMKEDNRVVLNMKFDLSADFRDLNFMYGVETLNQHFIHGTYMHKSNNEEESISFAVSKILSDEIPEDVYVVTTLDDSIFSKFNVTDTIAKFKEENNIKEMNNDALVKVLLYNLDELNRSIYNKLKNIAIEDC